MMLSGNYGLGASLVRESFREASACFRGRGQMLGNMIHVANHVAVMLRVSLGLFFFGFPQFFLSWRLRNMISCCFRESFREASACFRNAGQIK